jgi:hypothetical protein
MTDLISREDALQCKPEFLNPNPNDNPNSYLIGWNDAIKAWYASIKALPSAEAVSREDYEETDGVIAIEKQSAKDVGKIKHIIIRSPNYTRYFYNESMPIPNEQTLPSAEAVQGWIPCSERLPDVDVEVLTTTDWSEILIAWYRKDGAWETDEYILANDEILAWMPLPKPYKGGEDE